MQYLLVVLVLGLTMLAFERCHPGQRFERVEGWHARAIALTTVQAVVGMLSFLAWDRWFAEVALWHVAGHGLVADALLGYFVITFIYYWWHRARHEIPALWRWLHQIHHSACSIEVLTSFYKHPVEILINGVLTSAILYFLLGLDTGSAGLAVLLAGLAELFYHWNVRTPRWLGYLIQRPESHCVHHQRGWHRSNYSDLPLWDILFGTFANPRTAPMHCGFGPDAERRLFRMLAGRSASADSVPAPKNESPEGDMRSLLAKTPSICPFTFASVRLIFPAAIALFFAACALIPRFGQDPGYHAFADQRPWLDIPHAADVLSNLAFALVGVVAIARLVSARRMRFAPPTESGMWCVAIGLVGTAAGSAWYHLEPSNASLFWDRLPMTLVFAGVLGTALAQRVPGAAQRFALPLLAVLGAGTVVYWRVTGDLSPYMALQLGGILLLLVLLVVTDKRSDPFPWAWVIAWYAVAKGFESFDRAIWDATGGIVAGHALKHLAAAAASAAALWPLFDARD